MKLEAAFDGGGEEVVPVGESVREPASWGVLEKLLECGAVFAPGVEVEDAGRAGCRPACVVVGVDVVADLGREEHGPDLVIGGEGDGRGGGVDGDVAVPAAQEVGGLQEAGVLVG